MESVTQDIRFAMRMFARRPLFTAVALLTLTLGIGATTSIFSVVNGVLLRPFPYPEAERLVVLWNTNPEQGQDEYRISGRDFFDFERLAKSYTGMTLVAGATASLTGDDLPPARVDGALVSASFFEVLGVGPLMGRAFRPEENQGRHQVVILSHALWKGRFAGARDIIGRRITLDGETVEVVGIMPPVALPTGGMTLHLHGPERPLYWMPLDYTLDWVSEIRAHVMVVVARMRPEVTLSQAQQEMNALARAMEGGPEGQGLIVRSLREQVVGDVGRDLGILMAAVALLLLMASANLAGLLLGRSAEREAEMGLRAALGAARRRLARQVVTEVLLLAFVGGAAGLVLARWGAVVILGLVPDGLPRQSEVGVDGVVLVFATITVVVAALVAGIAPSLRAARGSGGRGLRERARGAVAGRAEARVHRVIVVSQLGVASILLVGAGLLTKSFQELRSVAPGFDGGSMLTAALTLPDTRYGDADRALVLFDRLRDQVAGLPGVTSVALAMDHPLESTWWNAIAFPNKPAPEPGESPQAVFRPVSSGYFAALGIPVLEGREFDSRDGYDQPGVMVVNEAFVRRYFAGGPVLGEPVRFTSGRFIWGEDAHTEFEVVGVVGDVRFNGLREPSEPAFYIPLSQFPYQSVRLMVGTSAEPEALAEALQAEVWGLDPDLPITEVRSLDAILATALAQDRFNAILLATFALAAVVLAAAGIYGVLSHAVARRTKEMGVRMAMGARPAAVTVMVVRDAGAMAGLGLGAGLLASMALTRFLAALLFGVPANDPTVLLGVGIVLGLTAVAAGLVPALRAARTDPMDALRAD